MSDERLEWNGVLADEIAQVSRRHDGELPVESHLVGLAISGGGIRSATFGLGVLESLKRLGLLKGIDYLSTVSGGGYIGAWLSANCARNADRKRLKPELPDWLDPQADWRLSIAHLRRYSNYLSPKIGFFSADSWSMGAIWIRNTLLVQLTVVLAIAVALLLPRPLLEGFVAWPAMGHWRWASVVLFLLAVTGIAGNQMRLNRERGVKFLHSGSWKAGLVATIACGGAATFIAMHWGFDPFGYEPIRYAIAAPVSLLVVLAGFAAQPVAVKCLSLFWRGDDAPAEINYTQGWVQGLVVVPLMATGYLVAAVLWGQSTDPRHPLASVTTFGGFFMDAWRYWPMPLSIVFASLWLFSLVSLRRFDARGILVAVLAPLPIIVVLHALLSAIMVLLDRWALQPDEGRWLAFMWAPALVLYAFALTVNMLIGVLGRQSSESVREWWSRLGAWLGIYGFAWMLIAIVGVYGPYWVIAVFDGHPWKSLSTVGGWLATTLAGLWAGNSGATGNDVEGKAGKKTTRQQVMGVVAAVAPFVFIAGLLIAVATGLHLIILNNSLTLPPTLAELHSDYWRHLNQTNHMVVAAVFAVVVAALLLLAGRVDINEFSLNAFYRSRLSRCYLGATRFLPNERSPQNFTGFDEKDDLAMAELAGTAARPPAGPLHLVNCALNLGGSSDLALHTRHSASFTISPLATGSAYQSSQPTGIRTPIGFRRTATYGGEGGQTTLGQAISVSGAAASPNMGYHTSAVVAFLLTVFNVRLGWWFANPRWSASRSASPWFSLRYLLKELFGGADDKSRFLMISDGGHFENLAAYELVRRKCRVIVISDAECDPGLHFAGLGTLIRMCEVDFGARIEIDVDAIRRGDKSRWSTQSFAVGRIVYGSGTPDGVLIYLKASMTGDEDAAVLQYKSSVPAFPHESTGDQFYGEDQFESYRRLGRDVALRAFGASPLGGGSTFVTMAMALPIGDGSTARRASGPLDDGAHHAEP